MRTIPFLDRLGHEMRRATRDDPPISGHRHLLGTGILLVGIAGIATVFLMWGQFYGSEDAVRGQTLGTAENLVRASDVDLLTASFEGIRDEIRWAQTLGSSPYVGGASGPYPRDVLDALGADFHVLHVPTYLPEGYSLYGRLRSGRGFDLAPRVQTRVVRSKDLSVFVIDQYARGFTPYSIEEIPGRKLQPVDIEGFRLYTRRDESGHAIYFFQRGGTWLSIVSMSPEDGVGLPAAEAAKIAMSLVAFEGSGWGDVQAVAPNVPLFSTGVAGESTDVGLGYLGVC